MAAVTSIMLTNIAATQVDMVRNASAVMVGSFLISGGIAVPGPLGRQVESGFNIAMTAAAEERGAEEPEEARERPVLQNRWYRNRWLYAAAAAIAIALLVPLMRESSRRSPVEALVALAPRSARACSRLGVLTVRSALPDSGAPPVGARA